MLKLRLPKNISFFIGRATAALIEKDRQNFSKSLPVALSLPSEIIRVIMNGTSLDGPLEKLFYSGRKAEDIFSLFENCHRISTEISLRTAGGINPVYVHSEINFFKKGEREPSIVIDFDIDETGTIFTTRYIIHS